MKTSPQRESRIRAELQFCMDILEMRELEDPDFRWLWSLKKNVAAACLKMWNPDNLQEYHLTDDEEREILRSNPLLENNRISDADKTPRDETDWYRQVRQKVETYIGNAKDSEDKRDG